MGGSGLGGMQRGVGAPGAGGGGLFPGGAGGPQGGGGGSGRGLDLEGDELRTLFSRVRHNKYKDVEASLEKGVRVFFFFFFFFFFGTFFYGTFFITRDP